MHLIRYFGHVFSRSLCDYVDIQHETRNMSVRMNTLIHRLGECSKIVHIFCLRIYSTVLWTHYTSKCKMKV